MSEQTPESLAGPTPLPDSPDLEWLRKNAKRRLKDLRQINPDAKLAEAQRHVANEYGFASWRALKAHVDSLTLTGQLFDAARDGDTKKLAALLDQQPSLAHARKRPYEWTLLHVAAHNGRLEAVNLLLNRGLDVNVTEIGDNTYAMHWAAAAGHLDVVRKLADAGGDVVGHGDDHELEVIGWATCWEGCDDDAHRSIAEFLISRGARHHIFSAIAINLADEVRRIVAADPATLTQRMSRNEDYQRPLHFAVRMNRPEMVKLLLELGADPLATDGTGYPPAVYAMKRNIDRSVMEAIRESGRMDLVTALALADWNSAAAMLLENPAMTEPGSESFGALHLMSKRGDTAAVKWLLDHGANPSGLWDHWDAVVTPLHLAALAGHTEVARLLLDAGADPDIHDNRHNADALGWAEFFGRSEIVELLKERRQA